MVEKDKYNLLSLFSILEVLLELLSRGFGLKYIKCHLLKTLFFGVYLETREGDKICRGKKT